MTEPSWRQAKDIVFKAIDLEPDGRSEFVKEVCGSDEALRRQVDELLSAHEEAGGFLSDVGNGRAPATCELPRSQPGFLPAGTAIGPYKVLQAIGEGGFGQVYMAEQSTPVRRQVALKIIKLGMTSREVLARFEAERQALALMDHPNIAKVLDAGETPEGQPYFVMELARGIPITEYCDTHSLSVRERLELFIPICHALQHAHQKGIIHRDIKPSNILITLQDEQVCPKVIDFGVAKAIHRRLTDRTLITEHGQLVGTPVYMSPEQARMSGLDVDTRSDIYSLGVLLYELLTGALPFEPQVLRNGDYREIQNVIVERDLPKPSDLAFLGKLTLEVAARHRATDERGLRRVLRHDLDWITMRCVEKDRTRRYQTASGLAMDVERYLTDQPVLAGPPSTRYRLAKFVKRNRIAVAASVLIVVSLLVGVFATTLALQSALHEHESVERVSAFYEDLFGNPFLGAGASAGPGPVSERSLRAMLRRADHLATEHFDGRPLLEVRARRTVGQALWAAGERTRGIEELNRAATLALDHLEPGSPDSLATVRAYGTSLIHQRVKFQATKAETILTYGLTHSRRTLGEHDPGTIDFRVRLGWAHRWAGAYHPAEEKFRAAIDSLDAVPGGSQRDELSVLAHSGLAYVLLARHGLQLEPEPELLRQALMAANEACAIELGAFRPERATALSARAEVLTAQGQHGEALTAHLAAYEAYLDLYGVGHSYVTLPRFQLTFAYIRAQRTDEALEQLKEELLKQEGEVALDTRALITDVLLARGEIEAASDQARDLVTQLQLQGGATLTGAHAAATLAALRQRKGEREQAEALLQTMMRDATAAGISLLEYRQFYPELCGPVGRYLRDRTPDAEQALPYLLSAWLWARGEGVTASRERQLEAARDMWELYETMEIPEKKAWWQRKIDALESGPSD